MYIPTHFKGKVDDSLISFIRCFPLGILISKCNQRLCASHLPFAVSKKNNRLLLSTHMAKENLQWEEFKNQEVMVVFSEPNAYISPSNYIHKKNVPTWNYLAAHLYGKVNLVQKKEEKEKVLKEMIVTFEKDYLKQWESINANYKSQLVDQIIAFELEISEIQFQKKLSQNKRTEEQIKIEESLSKSNHTSEKLLSEYMRMNRLNFKS